MRPARPTAFGEPLELAPQYLTRRGRHRLAVAADDVADHDRRTIEPGGPAQRREVGSQDTIAEPAVPDVLIRLHLDVAVKDVLADRRAFLDDMIEKGGHGVALADEATEHVGRDHEHGLDLSLGGQGTEHRYRQRCLRCQHDRVERQLTIGRGGRLPSRCLGRHCARYPPSTTKLCPVQYDDASEARNSAIWATSSGRPQRRSGIIDENTSRRSAGIASDIGVSIGPGTTQLTRIASGACSTARLRHRQRRPWRRYTRPTRRCRRGTRRSRRR